MTVRKISDYPPQWEIFFGKKRVGYARLKDGFLGISAPDARGRLVKRERCYDVQSATEIIKKVMRENKEKL
jgi:hypothetical protein